MAIAFQSDSFQNNAFQAEASTDIDINIFDASSVAEDLPIFVEAGSVNVSKFDTVTVAESVPVHTWNALAYSPSIDTIGATVVVAITDRFLLLPGYLNASGSKIRIQFRGGCNGYPLKISEAYIYKSNSAGELIDYEDTPVQILFQGSASINAYGDVTSDEITINFDKDTAYVIGIYILPTSGIYYSGGVTSYSDQAVNEAATVNPSQTNYSSSTEYCTVSEVYITDGYNEFPVRSTTPTDVSFGSLPDNYHYRARIQASELPRSVSQFVLRLSDDYAPFSITCCYVGHRAASGDPWDVDSFTQVFFDGGNAGFTAVDIRDQAVSDPVVFDLDETRDLIISFVTVNTSRPESYGLGSLYFNGYVSEVDDPNPLNSLSTASGGVTNYAFVHSIFEDFTVIGSTYDSVTVAESVSATINLSIDTYESVSVSEFTDVYTIAVVADIDISVYDSSSVTEDVVVYLNVTISSFDIVTVADVSTVDRVENVVNIELKEDNGESVVVSENLSIYVSIELSVVDSCALNEYVVLAVSAPEVSIFDTILVVDSAGVEVLEPSAGPTIYVDQYDSVSVAEYVSVVNALLNIDTYSTCGVSDYVNAYIELSINLYDSAGVEDVISVSILEATGIIISIFSAVTLSEYVVVDNAVCPVSVYDDINAEDFHFVEVEGLLPDLSISVFDTISIAEYVLLQESDLVGYVSDVISVLDTAVLLITIAVQATEQISLSEDITNEVEAVADLAIAVVDIVSVIEDISIVRDHVITVIDTVTTSDIINCQIVVLVAVTDNVSTDSSFVSTEIITGINISDTITVSEYTAGVSSDLYIRVSDSVSTTESVRVYWIIASGVLVLDVDVIVPICGVEVMVPGIDVKELIPSCDIELKSASINIYAMLPTIDLEMQT